MQWLFGKKSKSVAETKSSPRKVTDPQVTIVRLRENIQVQEKREDHILKKIEGLGTEAKSKMAKGDKRGALFLMKQRKLYQTEIDKIQNVKMTLETQVINLESAAQNAQTFQAMQEGTSTMKKIRTDVGIDDVDNVMDDIKEEMDMAQDINNAFTQPVDPVGVEDDDELLAELEGLSGAELYSMPAVPSKKMPALSSKKSEADEIKKLQAELAGL